MTVRPFCHDCGASPAGKRKGCDFVKTLQVKNKNTALTVSKLIFGTTYLGNLEDYTAGFEQMDCYYQLGGRCIDTARIYSNFEPTDKRPSEEVVGEWMQKTGLRKELIISTKGGHPDYGHMDRPRLGRDELSADLAQSLEALQTDYIDIYWLHRDDVNRPVREIMETLHSFVADGRVRVLGASNWSTQRINEANSCAEEFGLTPFSSSQIQWSLGHTTPADLNDETLICVNNQNYKEYQEMGMPLFAFESQAKGLYSKLGQLPEEELPQKLRNRFLTGSNRAVNLARAGKVQQLCSKYGVSPAVISLAYLTCNPLSAGAIIGCSNLDQLKDSMGAADFVLSPDEVKWLGED